MDDDILLSSYIDNALNDAEVAAVVERLAAEPAFAARLSALRQNDALLRAAYDQPMREQPPLNLLVRIKNLFGDNVIPLSSKTRVKDANQEACWLLPSRLSKPLTKLYRKRHR
jgi:hypothetical protein